MSGPYGLELVEHCPRCSLRRDGFFCALPTAVLQDFQLIKYTAAYPQDAILFTEGEPARGIYILCQGEVKLSMNSIDGRTLILRVAQPGEALGLNACISGMPHDVTAQTHRPCQTDFVKSVDFLHFLQRHNDVCLHAAQQLSQECLKTRDVLRWVGGVHSARKKMAQLILARAENSNGQTFRLDLTHQELSEVIGTSRETVTRTLAEFERMGLVFKKRGLLQVLDKAGLERLCA